MIHVWIGHAPPDVLSQERRSADHFFLTLIAGIVRNHARGSRGRSVVAWTRGGHLGATPCSAQQRTVLPNRHCQHDRKYKCSKHVMLGSGRRARRTPTTRREEVAKQAPFGTFNSLLGPGLRDFPIRCRKSRSASSPPTGQSMALDDGTSNAVTTLSRMTHPTLLPVPASWCSRRRVRTQRIAPGDWIACERLELHAQHSSA